MRALLTYLVIVCLLCNGCIQKQENTRETGTSIPNEYSSYADKYSLEKIGEYYLVKVFNPWQNAGHSEFSYLLGDDQDAIPDSLKDILFIQTPVKRAILMSTTFISLIDAVDELPSISGISGSKYVYNRELRKRIEQGYEKPIQLAFIRFGSDRGIIYWNGLYGDHIICCAARPDCKLDRLDPSCLDETPVDRPS